MSIKGYARAVPDRFEPEAHADPTAQRRVRGLLEAIDYMAFAANVKVLGATLGVVSDAKLRGLAEAAAVARARWIAESLAAVDQGPAAGEATATKLAASRAQFEELAAAYDALRRAVERGYVKIAPSGRA